jgi:hypothetical protein
MVAAKCVGTLNVHSDLFKDDLGAVTDTLNKRAHETNVGTSDKFGETYR